MKKDEALALLDSIESSLRRLRTDIRKVNTTLVSRKDLRGSIEQICVQWFERVAPALIRFAVSEDVKKKYDGLFSILLQLGTRVSRKKTYLKTIEEILPDFKDDLYISVMKSAGQIVSIEHITSVLEGATQDEAEYLEEALGCASQRFFRASVVLGWSAAVNRMHRVVERLGFEEFNKKSEAMKGVTQGRFKRFNKSFTIHSLSELRATVFDTDLLWVLEYWELIDANQHDRLEICFTMRSNAAHPGEAPITEENLASFYSDLKSMVFDNPKFSVQNP